MASKKAQFASKVGLIAATVGSAVGLGNVWRFPAETQANGGAAFLLIYIACVFLLGVPVMVAEFALGRAGRSDAVGCFKNLGAKRPWWAVGLMAILASYMILCFYMVVAGWTFEYLWASITGALYEGAGAGNSGFFSGKMAQMLSSSSAPLVNTYIVIALNIVVLLLGVQKGIERMSNIMMPLLFVILLVLCGVSMTLPGATAGLEFFLKPDFSKVTSATVLSALGQAFFSLSLGMGILITYASYFPRSTKLTRTAVTVSMLDLLVAILMGFIIFPAVTSFGLSGEELRGSTLVFVTLPEVFARMPATQLWSILFFLLLFVAALTSTISIAEVSVAFVCDRFKTSRTAATFFVLIPIFGLSSLCALSQGPLSHLTIGGLTIFDLLDDVATNMLLPIVSFFICIYVGWIAPRNLLKGEMTNRGEMRSRFHSPLRFILRWVAPILTAVILLSRFL
ncbi:MAG: sodium-dependent transporter [Pseudoflavonifractor sp.]|nr:sodium-dependent transporter [Alloprevotella sp.]MCM1117711.1 sodium-dependent transporter [Pseudoflavonifractor sp.]